MEKVDMEELLCEIESKGWKLDYVYLDSKANRFEVTSEKQINH